MIQIMGVYWSKSQMDIMCTDPDKRLYKKLVKNCLVYFHARLFFNLIVIAALTL